MTSFMIFSEIFTENLNVKNFRKFEDFNPVIGIFEGTLRGLRSLPQIMAALIFVVSEIWPFFRFFSKFFRKLKYKKFHRT